MQSRKRRRKSQRAGTDYDEAATKSPQEDTREGMQEKPWKQAVGDWKGSKPAQERAVLSQSKIVNSSLHQFQSIG